MAEYHGHKTMLDGTPPMTNPQTEARAIVRWTRDAAGWVEWPDGEWVRYSDHTTALAEKDAELSVQIEAKEHARRECERAEAALAETRKVLDALDRMSRGVDWCDQDEQARRWSAARRVLEGGKVDG